MPDPSAHSPVWTAKLVPGFAQVAHDHLLSVIELPPWPLNADSYEHSAFVVAEHIKRVAFRMRASTAAGKVGTVRCPLWWLDGVNADASAALGFFLLWHVRYGDRSSGALVSEHQLPGAVVRHETHSGPDGPATRITFGRTLPSGVTDWGEGIGCHGGVRFRSIGTDSQLVM